MAIICRDHRLLFIMAPRTGCTAIGQLLVDELGGVELTVSPAGAPRRVAARNKHATLPELLRYGALTADERRALFAFTAVRNPFDSLVSLYLKQASTYQPLLEDPGSWASRSRRRRASMSYARDHTFEEWLVNTYERSTVRRLTRGVRRIRGSAHRWAEGVDFVMQFERLQEDFDEALRRAGVDRRLEIPRVNVTDGREEDYRAYYTDRARDIVERHFRHQLDRYGYSFGVQ